MAKMKLLIQVLDSANGCRFNKQIEVEEELFHSPDMSEDSVSGLFGIKTALDFALMNGER